MYVCVLAYDSSNRIVPQLSILQWQANFLFDVDFVCVCVHLFILCTASPYLLNILINLHTLVYILLVSKTFQYINRLSCTLETS